MQRLPTRIAEVMIGILLVSMVALGAAMLWMSEALDDQALQHSTAQIGDTRDSLLDQIGLTAIDNAKWDAAVERIDAADLPWIYENVGSSATIGQVMNLAVIWGGRWEEDVGWTDDGVEEGRAGLVGADTLRQVEGRLAAIPVGTYDAVRFFAWREGSIFAMAASRLESAEAPGAAEVDDAGLERLLLGRRIAAEDLEGIAHGFLLTGLGILRGPPADRPFVPLAGADGEPIAYLAWDAPRPGATQLRAMLPPLLLVLALILGLAALGIRLLRQAAQRLVLAERVATAAALRDGLTGLPNRVAFARALAQPAPAGEKAVLFLDVNGLKRINDSLGHAAGDEVIVRVARRLEALAAPDCVLARIGGDEFVFVLTGPDAGFRAEWLAHAAERALLPAIAVGGHRLQVQAAMGHAVQATDGTSGDELVRQADLAMYEAKRRGGQGPVAFGEVAEDQAGHAARLLERALRDAIGREGELWIAYQPVVAADGRRLVRAEALARWTSAELGSVPPDSFIPAAERAGLIAELGRRLLQLVCDDLVAHPALRVSVNISRLQLMGPDFVRDLLEMLGRRGIDPARLEVEVTEEVLADDHALLARRIRELRGAGIATALNDFGTGRSSIGALRRMEFEALKIDRSYVAGLDAAPERRRLVGAMIRLAHALDLRVVCVGVETEQELAALRELGCDQLQGFGIGRPLPIDLLAGRWLSAEAPAAA